MRYLLRPYDILLITAVTILLVSFFIDRQLIYIHIHDTMYVIDYTYLFRTSTVILIILWVLYKLTNKILFSKKLSLLNIILNIIGLLTFLTWPIWTDKNQTREINRSIWVSFDKTIYDDAVISFAILVFIIAQLLFLTNIIIGLIKKSNYANK